MPLLPNDLYSNPELAERYASVGAQNIYNAEYERPAMEAVVGRIAGLDVLDAGCAAGSGTAKLVAGGAHVTALDGSSVMADLARKQLRGTARVVHADLTERLPFTSEAFDLVVSSLTMHYLAAWQPTLAEFARVLRPSGRVVISTNHPWLTAEDRPNYHEQHLVIEPWSGFSSEPVEVRFYHRPLAQILSEIVGAGFALARIVEPQPTTAIAKRAPKIAARLASRPCFLIVEARRG